MGIILDVIVVAVVAIFVLIGAKRGFAKTAVETIGFFLAAYLSFTLCTPIAKTISDNTIRPAVVSNVSQAIADTTQAATGDATQMIWDTLPEYVRLFAEKSNITPETLSGYLNGSASNGTEAVAITVADNVIMPLVYNLVKIICSVILFIILLIIVKLLAVLINKVFKLPLLNKLNSTVGAIFGGIQGVMIAIVLCIIVTAVISINTNGFWIFTSENIEASNLFKLLCTITPFK